MIENGIIRNCGIGVNLNRTSNSLSFGTGQESSIINDAQLIDNYTAIWLFGNHGMTIEDSYFSGNEISINNTNASVNVYDNDFVSSGIGIWISALYPNIIGSDIRRNSFVDTYTILCETQNNAAYIDIVNNTSINGPYLTYGLSRFRIFSNDLLDAGPVFAAIESSATGNFISNEIANNSFFNNYIGNNVDGINNLHYLSNCFENTTKADIGLGTATTIRGNQGSPADEAANCFDNGSRLQTTETGAEFLFNYWLDPNAGGPPISDCKDPRNGSSNQNYVVDDAEFQITYNCGSGAVLFGEGLENYPQFADCEQFILDYPNDDAGLLTLIEILEEEINRIDAEIDAGNINSYVGERLIRKYKECIDNALSNLIISALETTNGNDFEELIETLQNRNDFRYWAMAYGIMIEKQEYTRARSFLNSIVTNVEDQTDFINCQNIYLDYLENPDVFELSEQQQDLLYFTGMKALPFSGMSRAIYYYLTGNQILLEIPLYDASPRIRSLQKTITTEVNIYPNPSDESQSLFIDFNGGEFIEDANYKVTFYNVSGDIAHIQYLTKSVSSIDFISNHGLYFVKIEIEGEIIFTGNILRI